MAPGQDRDGRAATALTLPGFARIALGAPWSPLASNCSRHFPARILDICP